MKCDNCGKKIKGNKYKWKGLTPRYCSIRCAAIGCPHGILECEGTK